jgi:hypothetical protein
MVFEKNKSKFMAIQANLYWRNSEKLDNKQLAFGIFWIYQRLLML